MPLVIDHSTNTLVTDSGDLIVSATSNIVKINSTNLSLEQAQPVLRFIETDQTGAAGKIRFTINGDIFYLQRNTDITTPFATNSNIFTIGAGSTIINFSSTPTVNSSNIYHAGNFIAGTDYLVPSALNNLNATNLTTGTVPNARLSGTYDGINIKLNATNTVFGAYDVSRTVYDLVSYRNATNNATGSIVFTAPLNVSVMNQWVVRGYVYTPTNNLIDFTVFAYKSLNLSPLYYQIVHKGNYFPSVRIAVNSSNLATLIIGDIDTVWSYPHISIVMASFSHSGVTDSYCYGWTSALVTDLSTYSLMTPDLTTNNDYTYVKPSWIKGTIAVANGGTGASTFTSGYLKASGTTAFSTVSTIPETD